MSLSPWILKGWLRCFAAGLLMAVMGGCRASLRSSNIIPTPAPTIRLAFLGDVMLGRGVHPSSGWPGFLEPSIRSADLALANLESPLSTAPARADSPYILCARPTRVQYLSSAGFDLVSIANNHQYDCGVQGASETRSVLTRAGLGYIDSRPTSRLHNDIPLTFLAFDATGELDTRLAVQAVREAHDSGSLVIVSMHWGAEYQSSPSNRQQQLAQHLSQAGAVLIWGHHPHVLQQAEWINHGRTLVLYSLGNALFDQYGLSSTRQSALVLVTLNLDGVIGFDVIPFVIDVPHSRIVEPQPVELLRIQEYFPQQ